MIIGTAQQQYPLPSMAWLNQAQQATVVEHWQLAEVGHFDGKEGCQLAYLQLLQPNPAPMILMISGRVESYLKYQEMISELYQQGYSVVIYDHRGQGLSDRLLENSHKGHVVDFNDYVQDLAQFVEQVVTPLARTHSSTDLYLFAHSMGGCIASLYLQEYPHPFKSAILSAPMFGIQLPLPQGLIELFAEKMSACKGADHYIIGGHDYKDVAFNNNELTSDPLRYAWLRMVYEQYPQIKLGSPTYQWLLEAFEACRKAILSARQSRIPMKILIAQFDSIVDLKAQLRTQGGYTSCEVVVGAKHELSIEQTTIRNKLLQQIKQSFV